MARYEVKFTEEGIPCAPTQEEWDAMTEQQRSSVVDALPITLTDAEFQPEGDLHFGAKVRIKSALEEFFSKLGRKVYVAAELGVYYPGVPRFAPDILAVMDVENHPRNSWVVSKEGRGLDLAIEVIVKGHPRKDTERNVARYAALGISEYFIFDQARSRLNGFHLSDQATRRYLPIIPQYGRYASRVLALDLMLEGDRLRFFSGSAALPDSVELVRKLETLVEQVQRNAEADARRAEEESRRADDAQQKLEEALAELERLRGKPRD